MAFPGIRGFGIGLPNPLNSPSAPQTAPNNATVAINPAFASVRSNALTLNATEVFNIPAGTYQVGVGNYTFLQYLDPVSTQWRTIDTTTTKSITIDSDGGNYRLANLTGCPVGALITNAGSGYTNGIGATATGLTVTASAGSSVWVPVVGGAVSATVTSVAAGANYTYPPIVVIDAPPTGGLQATGYCTLSSGGVTSVTISNQGAGYSAAPGITFINDLRDSTGAGASYTTTLAGSGTLTALYPSNPGNSALTAAPTFTFSPASTTAATAVMNWTVTGYTVTTAGTTYTAPVIVGSGSNLITGTSILTNPAATTGLSMPRPARVVAALNTSTVTVTGYVVEDGGLGIQTIPKAIITTEAYPTLANSTALVLTVGGVTDTSYLQPI